MPIQDGHAFPNTGQNGPDITTGLTGTHMVFKEEAHGNPYQHEHRFDQHAAAFA